MRGRGRGRGRAGKVRVILEFLKQNKYVLCSSSWGCGAGTSRDQPRTRRGRNAMKIIYQPRSDAASGAVARWLGINLFWQEQFSTR